jgi:hypothetical protein
MPTSPESLRLLSLLADLAPRGTSATSDQLAHAAFDAKLHEHHALDVLEAGDEYWDFREELDELEAEGLIEVDRGPAELEPAGTTAPVVREVGLALTDEGWAVLEPRNPA